MAATPQDQQGMHALNGDAARTEEERATSTPLSVRFEFVGCEFASPEWHSDSILPTYTFRPPCPFGKNQPNQDCRLCSHHRIHVLGAGEPYWRQRYHGRGYVFPIKDEATADAIMDVLEANDGMPLTRPDWGKPEGAE